MKGNNFFETKCPSALSNYCIGDKTHSEPTKILERRCVLIDIYNLTISAKKGNKQAFYDLISNYRGLLYGTAIQYLKNEFMALEAVQEVTYRAYLKIHKLKNPDYFATWLTRIMINYCLSELEKQKRLSSLEDWQCVSQGSNESQYDAVDLKCCIETLKPKYRDVIVMRYYEDMSVKDIAHALSKPSGTIKTWIRRGLSQMRNNLKGGNANV